MIDFKNIKRGDKFWTIDYESLWESEYAEDYIDIPICVSEKIVSEVYVSCNTISFMDGSVGYRWSIFLNKKDAMIGLKKERMASWKDNNLEVVFEKLKKLKRFVKKENK
mgnify:CR=1 FL=1